MSEKTTQQQISLLQQALQRGESEVIEQLYRSTYPHVARLVKQNKGTEDDAQDLFQESLIILIQKLRAPGFRLEHTPSTYLYGIARFQWLNRLRKDKRNPVDLILDEPDSFLQIEDAASLDFEAVDIKQLQVNLLLKALQGLGTTCQQLIKMKHLEKYTHEEIMKTMNLSSIAYSRLRLSQCMDRLRNLLKKDPEFKNA